MGIIVNTVKVVNNGQLTNTELRAKTTQASLGNTQFQAMNW